MDSKGKREEGDRNDRNNHDRSRGERERDRYDNNYPRKKKYIFKEGDWECPNDRCSNQNFAKRLECNLCKTPNPKNKSRNLDRSRSRSRDRDRDSRKYRERTYRKSERSLSRSRSRSRSDSYQRSHRQNGNIRGNNANVFKEGDWKCENCNNINFAWRSKCNICKRSKSMSRDSREKKYERRNYREESRVDTSRKRSSRDEPRSKRRHDKHSRSLSESSLFSSPNFGNRKKRSHSRDFSPKGQMPVSIEYRVRDRSPSGSKSQNIINVKGNDTRNRNDRSRSSGRSDSVHKMRFSEIDN